MSGTLEYQERDRLVRSLDGPRVPYLSDVATWPLDVPQSQNDCEIQVNILNKFKTSRQPLKILLEEDLQNCFRK